MMTADSLTNNEIKFVDEKWMRSVNGCSQKELNTQTRGLEVKRNSKSRWCTNNRLHYRENHTTANFYSLSSRLILHAEKKCGTDFAELWSHTSEINKILFLDDFFAIFLQRQTLNLTKYIFFMKKKA